MPDKQTRVCIWLPGARCKHRSFLDFPEDVRNKIYRHVGFTRYDYIQYDGAPEPQATLEKPQQGEQQNQSAHDDLEKDDEESEYDTDEESEYDSDEDPAEIEDHKLAKLLRDPEVKGSVFGRISLMLCCKTMYREILLITYPKYHFRITHSPLVLRRMTADSTALLTSLELDLHVADGNMIPDHPGPDSSVEHVGPLDDELQTSSPRTAHLLMGWLEALDHLARHITPDVLGLSLICDVDSLTLASAFVSPLLALPRLRQCSLRLSARPDPQIRQPVRRISQTCTGTSRPDTPAFRYMDLPRELRLLTMSFTDLVTPLQEIHWDSQEGYHLQWSDRYGTHLGDTYDTFDRKGADLHDCWISTEERCFCARYHAAYCDECKCWMPPTPLFLVFKDLRLDAVEVFFRNNRFCILPSLPPDHHVGCSPVEDLAQPLPLYYFLRSAIPDLGLPHLRSIELVFGPVRMHNPLHAQLPGFYDRLSVEVTFLREHLHLSRLTLVVHMADLCHHSASIPNRAAVPDKVLRRVGRMYENIGKRLSKLSGLKCFYAFLAEPLRWSIEAEANTEDGDELISDLKSAREIDMESLVMGDAYTTVNEGKMEYIQSAWYVKNEGWDEIYR